MSLADPAAAAELDALRAPGPGAYAPVDFGEAFNTAFVGQVGIGNTNSEELATNAAYDHLHEQLAARGLVTTGGIRGGDRADFWREVQEARVNATSKGLPDPLAGLPGNHEAVMGQVQADSQMLDAAQRRTAEHGNLLATMLGGMGGWMSDPVQGVTTLVSGGGLGKGILGRIAIDTLVGASTGAAASTYNQFMVRPELGLKADAMENAWNVAIGGASQAAISAMVHGIAAGASKVFTLRAAALKKISDDAKRPLAPDEIAAVDNEIHDAEIQALNPTIPADRAKYLNLVDNAVFKLESGDSRPLQAILPLLLREDHLFMPSTIARLDQLKGDGYDVGINVDDFMPGFRSALESHKTLTEYLVAQQRVDGALERMRTSDDGALAQVHATEKARAEMLAERHTLQRQIAALERSRATDQGVLDWHLDFLPEGATTEEIDQAVARSPIRKALAKAQEDVYTARREAIRSVNGVGDDAARQIEKNTAELRRIGLARLSQLRAHLARGGTPDAVSLRDLEALNTGVRWGDEGAIRYAQSLTPGRPQSFGDLGPWKGAADMHRLANEIAALRVSRETEIGAAHDAAHNAQVEPKIAVLIEQIERARAAMTAERGRAVTALGKNMARDAQVNAASRDAQRAYLPGKDAQDAAAMQAAEWAFARGRGGAPMTDEQLAKAREALIAGLSPEGDAAPQAPREISDMAAQAHQEIEQMKPDQPLEQYLAEHADHSEGQIRAMVDEEGADFDHAILMDEAGNERTPHEMLREIDEQKAALEEAQACLEEPGNLEPAIKEPV